MLLKSLKNVQFVSLKIRQFLQIYNNLLELKAEHDRKTLQLNDEKLEVKAKVDKLRYEGLESLTRKQVDEVGISLFTNR